MSTLFDTSPVTKSAEISECGKYRWRLRRQWDGGDGRKVCFVMLNPSTADASIDDPTIRRCVNFARGWGFSILEVRNLFPYRATDPRELKRAIDPGGGRRGREEISAAREADLVICAWGAGSLFGRDREAVWLLDPKPLFCLGTSKEGHPRHPLYLRNDATPIPFRPEP